MRKRLMAAAAMAPLSLLCLNPAKAQTTLSNSSATPLTTAAGGDITIASGGSLQPTASGAAVTLNSNNAVTNSGAISTKDVDNAVGILVPAGAYTGSISNAGTITLTESYTPSDSVNNDGIVEAPFAQGTGRFGIQTLGVLTGAITNTGTISIQGNNSAGIYIANGLNGTLVNSGTITVNGDNAFGVRTAGEVTGSVQLTGAVSVKGANSVAVQTGQIDQSLTVYTTVTSTGYADTTRVTGTTALQKIEATPTDVEQGGSALQVQGSVLGGIYLGAPPAGTVSTDTTTDADNDGIVDSAEGTAAIATYGSAPAIQIGGSTPIKIGNFTTSGYGLKISGSVSANGVYDGVSATAIDIGTGGAGVNLSGGINIIGSVSATAYQANATAIHLESGTVGGALVNNGTLVASLTSGSANTATALVIDAGASLSNLTNYGTLAAGTTGDATSALAVVDKGGGITYVENTGTISATITPTTLGDTLTGKTIALDLSANTAGVTIHQELNDEVNAPSIVGDIKLGNGTNVIDLLSGTIKGSLSLGSGANDAILITNGASYVGALTYGGSSLSINLANGTLQNNATGAIGVSNLSVGSTSALVFAIDPVNKASTVYNVSGAATFASGATIGATLLSLPTSSQTYTLVKAGSLSVGGGDAALLTTLPYLFDGSLKSNTAAGTIALTVSTKTPTELQLNKAETSAYAAVLAALPHDANIQTAVISAATRATFISAYDQLLPDSGGDVFQTALSMSKAISRATADRFDLSTQNDDDDAPDTTGVWASEYYIGVNQSKVENNAVHSAGLGVIGGVDFGGYGATLSLASANATRPHDTSDTLNSISTVEGGLYLAPRFGPINIDARVGVGYLKMTDRRQFIASIVSGDTSTTTTVSRTASGNWSGYDLTGHLGAGVQADVTKHLFFQPKVYVDFFHTQENAYNESGTSTGYDLNVSARASTQTSATASIVAGMKFGNSFVFSPQIELGYDDVVQGGPGNTTAQFAYGGPSFTVQPNSVGGAAVARFALKGDGNYVHFSFQGGGEFRTNYHALDLRAVFRMTY